jgi:flagellar basal body-associated protein FliL
MLEDSVGKGGTGKMRKRIFILLLLPIFIVLWIIGWTFLFFGRQKSSSKNQKENVTIMPVLREEAEEITAT